MWDTPHSALPRRVIGSSTDAVSLDGSSLISVERHEGALPGAPDTVAAQTISVHFAQSTAYRNILQPWRGQRSLSELGIHPRRRIPHHLCTSTECECKSTIA